LDIALRGEEVIMTGYFDGELKIDEFVIEALSDQFNGYAASFQTSAGTANWLRLAGGSSQLISSQVMSDDEGKIILGGYFLGTAFFDDNILVSNGFSDIFVAEMKEISISVSPQILNSPEIKIYPNPAGSILNISLEPGVFQIKIFDMQGRLKVMRENENTIDISALPPGNYLIEAGNESFVTRSIFVKP
jgi:hypothetical protein